MKEPQLNYGFRMTAHLEVIHTNGKTGYSYKCVLTARGQPRPAMALQLTSAALLKTPIRGILFPPHRVLRSQ